MVFTEVFVLVLSIKNAFVKIENSIFLTKYTRYGQNVEKKNSLLQRDLQIYCQAFFHMSYIFCLLMKNVIEILKFTSEHFLIGRVVFVLIVENVVKNSILHQIYAEYEKMFGIGNCSFQKYLQIFYKLFFHKDAQVIVILVAIGTQIILYFIGLSLILTIFYNPC